MRARGGPCLQPWQPSGETCEASQSRGATAPVSPGHVARSRRRVTQRSSPAVVRSWPAQPDRAVPQSTGGSAAWEPRRRLSPGTLRPARAAPPSPPCVRVWPAAVRPTFAWPALVWRRRPLVWQAPAWLMTPWSFPRPSSLAVPPPSSEARPSPPTQPPSVLDGKSAGRAWASWPGSRRRARPAPPACRLWSSPGCQPPQR